MNSNENVLSKASEERASEEIQDAASRSLRGARVKHLRVVHVDHFEAAVPLADYEQSAFRRRFCTLFVDDERTRTGGLGRVMFAQNAMGEALALKTMLPVANDAGTSDAATEEINPEDAAKRREQLRGRAFRREYGSTGRLAASRESLGCMAMEVSMGHRRSSWNGSTA